MVPTKTETIASYVHDHMIELGFGWALVTIGFVYLIKKGAEVNKV